MELTHALKEISTNQPRKLSCHMKALEQLSNIFKTTLSKGTDEPMEQRARKATHFDNPEQRVDSSNENPPTSSNPTQHQLVHTTKLTHLKHTWNNTLCTMALIMNYKKTIEIGPIPTTKQPSPQTNQSA